MLRHLITCQRMQHCVRLLYAAIARLTESVILKHNKHVFRHEGGKRCLKKAETILSGSLMRDIKHFLLTHCASPGTFKSLIQTSTHTQQLRVERELYKLQVVAQCRLVLLFTVAAFIP